MTTNKLTTTTSLVVALVLFLALNILVSTMLRGTRVDLTEEKLYTLSQGTRNILGRLEEPITLRFYYSKDLARSLPSIRTYAEQVLELLEQYESASGGKIRLEVIDPEPFTEEEDRAVQYGLQAVPLDQAGNNFYFGLAGTNTTDDEAVIRFFQPERESFLEYDITKLIHTLAEPKKPVVGMISSLPILGSAPQSFLQQDERNQPWMITEQMRQLFEVRDLGTEIAEIPEDVDVLMLVHPKNLSDAALYAIDQYLLAGGRALVFVDPHAEAEEVPQNPQNPLAGLQVPRESNLPRLFDSWGVTLDSPNIAADRKWARMVNAGSQRRPEPTPYIVWLNLEEDAIDRDDVVTSQLQNVSLASSGYLLHDEEAGTTFEPLLQTSEESMTLDRSRIMIFPQPAELLEQFESQDERLTLAARVSGKIASAFPDGAPEVEDEAEDTEGETEVTEPDAGHLAEGTLNVLVFADVDLLTDNQWVQIRNFLGQRIGLPVADNAAMVINAIDNMSGSEDLISVRARGRYSRPFEYIRDLQEEAGRKYQERLKQTQQRLDEINQRLSELEAQTDSAGRLILSPEQRQEIEKAREEQIAARKELRQLRANLNRDVDRLSRYVWLINIGLMPLVVAIFAIGMGLYQRYRRRGVK